MKNFFRLFVVLPAIFFSLPVFAQSNSEPKPFMKSPDGYARMEDSLKNQFDAEHIAWPPLAMYIRSFKYDRQLEVWIKGDLSKPYRLFKTYKVCQQSGSMGPKRVEGDYQVPEGFYYINEFNPNSNYHFALGLSYPNASDKILSDQSKPGSAIYIHGDCVSTGCIPLTDFPIEEVYFLATSVRAQGEEFIPVHVFPVRYNVKKSMDFLNGVMKDNVTLQDFNKNIKEMFDYFETKKELPIVTVNKKGEYILN